MLIVREGWGERLQKIGERNFRGVFRDYALSRRLVGVIQAFAFGGFPIAPFPKARILCTEDDSDTRAFVKYVLGGEGYEVVTAEHGAEALRLAQTQSFDLFLVDSWLPGMSGDELTQKIREFNSTTPILFYTGAAHDSDKESARASGAQGYLVKPSGVDELIHEVARLIAEAKIAFPVKVIHATRS